MALIYDEFALLPVGMSCQFAHQLRHQKAWLDSLVGQIGSYHATPLDWQIAPPPAAAWQIEREEFLPVTPEEIETRRTVPGFPEMDIHFWPEAGSSYWHEPAMLSEFGRVSNKFANMTKTWRNLRSRRVLAVFTNTQMNLASVHARNPDLPPVPAIGDLLALRDRLAKRFGRLHFHCVFRPERKPVGLSQSELDFSIYSAQDDETNWRGNDTEWQRLLPGILQTGGVRLHHLANH